MILPLLYLLFFGKVEENKEPEETTASCPACNGLVAIGASKCTHCGKSKPAPKPPTKVSKKHLAMACAALGVMIGTAINNPAPSSNPQSSWDVSNSPFDGSVRQVEVYLKRTLKDPDSFQAIEWGAVQKGQDWYSVTVKYRAKNSFGGYVVEQKGFLLDNSGNIKSIYEL